MQASLRGTSGDTAILVAHGADVEDDHAIKSCSAQSKCKSWQQRNPEPMPAERQEQLERAADKTREHVVACASLPLLGCHEYVELGCTSDQPDRVLLRMNRKLGAAV